MKSRQFIWFLVCAISGTSAPFSTTKASSIDSTANGEWTTAGTWNNTAAPSSGNDYLVTNGFTVDSPVAGSTISPGSVLTFGGDSLTVENGGVLRLRHTNDGGNAFVQYDLKELTLQSGSTLQSYNTARGNVTRRLNSDLVVASSGTVNIRIQSDNSAAWTNHLYLNGSLSGGADINLTGGLAAGSTGDRRILRITSANNTYSGNWSVTGDGGDDSRRLFLEADAVNALGTGTVTLNARSQLRVTSNGSINGFSAVTLNQSTSNLQFLNSGGWTNTSATLTANNGTIDLGTGASSIGSFVLNSAGTVTLNAGTGGSLAVGTALDLRQGTLSGTGGLTSSLDLEKTTSGTAIINTNNTLAGGTTISAGTLQIGTGGTTGTIGSGDISNNGTLVLNRSDAQSWNQQISGSGSFTIQGGTALTLTNTHSYTGTTRIENNSSLTLSGTGANRLAPTSSLAFAGTSSLALGNNDQTVASLSLPVANADSSTSITGSGTLTINGASPFNFGVSGNIGINVRTAAMNMTGLAGFTFNSPSQLFRVGTLPGLSTSTGGRPDSSFLTSNNTGITALSFLLGDQAGTGTGGNNTFRLGETTVINANTINIGASGRSNATLNFNTGLTNPVVTIRATDGTSRVNNWEIGRVAHFSTNTWTAVVDFSGGEIDALVNNLRIGIINTTNQTNRQGTQNSTFSMGRGVLDVTNLVIGEQSGSYTNNAASGTYAANGTFTLNHSDGLVTAGSIRLAENTGNLTGGTRSVSGTLNLQSGTIETAEIRLGDQTATSPATVTRNFNFSAGKVRNLAGQNLSIANIPINLTGTGTRIFEATDGQSITVASDAQIGGTGGFTKAGTGSMTIESTSTYSGDTIVSAGTLLVTGALTSSDVSLSPAATIAGTGTLGGDLAFGAGSFLRVLDLNDPLTVGGTVTFGTGFGIDNLLGIDWLTVPAGTYTLLDNSTNFSLAGLDHFGPANAYDIGNDRTAYFQNGSLQLVVVPEPRAALIGGLGTLLLLRRRRS